MRKDFFGFRAALALVVLLALAPVVKAQGKVVAVVLPSPEGEYTITLDGAIFLNGEMLGSVPQGGQRIVLPRSVSVWKRVVPLGPTYRFLYVEPLPDGSVKIGVWWDGFQKDPVVLMDFVQEVAELSGTTGDAFFAVPLKFLTAGTHNFTLSEGPLNQWVGVIVEYPIVCSLNWVADFLLDGQPYHYEGPGNLMVPLGTTVTLKWSVNILSDRRHFVHAPVDKIFLGGFPQPHTSRSATSGAITFVVSGAESFYFGARSGLQSCSDVAQITIR